MIRKVQGRSVCLEVRVEAVILNNHGCSSVVALTSPSGFVAAGVDVDEAGVEAEASLEEPFIAELERDLVGCFRAFFIDEVEGVVAGVEGLRSSSALTVIGGAAVGRGDVAEGSPEAVTDFVGDGKGGRDVLPKVLRWEFVLHFVTGAKVGGHYFVSSDVAVRIVFEELGVVALEVFGVTFLQSGFGERGGLLVQVRLLLGQIVPSFPQLSEALLDLPLLSVGEGGKAFERKTGR